jgi:hypothetical protein
MTRLHFLSAAFAISFALSACVPRTSYVHLYGQPASVTAAARTIEITPATKFVNVEGGETIRFLANGNAFAWTFDVGATVDSFDLNEIAPPGVLGRVVRAYVSPDPRYLNARSRSDD